MTGRRPPFALSGPEQERVDAVDRLAARGDEAIGELLEMLIDRSWTVRRAVIAALASLGEPAVGPLCQLLRVRRDDETRIAAAMDALVASIADPTAQLLLLAGDPNPATVVDAAMILGRRREPAGVDALIRLLEHRDDNVSVAAIEALGRIGGRRAVEALVTVLSSGRFFRVFPAMDVLGRSGDPRAVGPLAALLHDPLYAGAAARALAHTADRSAVAPLASLLDQPSEATVRAGAAALAELRDRHSERYGRSDIIDDALRRAAPVPAAALRLAQAVEGADPNEQVAIAGVLGVLGGDVATGALTRLLEGPERVASAAAAALEVLGSSADIPVRQALREGDSGRRRSLLPTIDRPSALEEVLLCLGDPDSGVRALACEAVGRIGNPTAARNLFPILADPSAGVVQAAVAAIQTLGSRDTETLARAAASSVSARVRRAALGILAYFGNPQLLDVFLAALEDPAQEVREAAIAGLPYVGGARALDAVLAAARATGPRTRAAAARALALWGSDPRACASLLRCLSDDDPWVRYYACQSLGRLRYELAAERITELLADPAGQVRVAAIEALSYMGSPAARGALERAAGSDDPDLERAALVGLGMTRHPEALPILAQAARSPDAATRLIAVSALGTLDSPEAIRPLAVAAEDDDPSVRAAALSVLAASGEGAAIDVLLDRLRAQPDDLAAARALSTPAPGRIRALARCLETADDDLAMRLVSALARMRVPEASEALLAAMNGPNPAARRAAASAVIALGTDEARAAVARASREDPDPEVRKVCALLLAG